MNEISKIKLGKTYGRHVFRVLGNQLNSSRKGWYQVKGNLPSLEEYKELEKKAFTHSLTDVVENAKSELESLRDELQDWYDNLPEGFRNGDKGDRLQEAVSS